MEEPQFNNPELERYFEKINWIEDENLLRDEGVLYGLTDSNVESKTEIIKYYFDAQNEYYNHKINFYKYRNINIDKLIIENENLKSLKTTQLFELINKQPENKSYLLRTTVGLIISFFICIGNYFIIKHFLNPYFPDNIIISIGVFLVGSFNLFSKISSLYKLKDRPENKLIWLEEFGIPLSASVFVFVWTINSYPIYISGAIFCFVFFCFLFSGKLFLSYLTEVKNEWGNYLFAKDFKIYRKLEIIKIESEIKEITILITDLINEKNSISEEILPFEITFAQIEAKKDMRIKIFESEFYLSRNYKSQLTDKQVNTLKSYRSA